MHGKSGRAAKQVKTSFETVCPVVLIVTHNIPGVSVFPSLLMVLNVQIKL